MSEMVKPGEKLYSVAVGNFAPWKQDSAKALKMSKALPGFVAAHVVFRVEHCCFSAVRRRPRKAVKKCGARESPAGKTYANSRSALTACQSWRGTRDEIPQSKQPRRT